MRRWGVPSFADFVQASSVVTASSRVDTSLTENREYDNPVPEPLNPSTQPSSSIDPNPFG